jgi:hypothetical protein
VPRARHTCEGAFSAGHYRLVSSSPAQLAQQALRAALAASWSLKLVELNAERAARLTSACRHHVLDVGSSGTLTKVISPSRQQWPPAQQRQPTPSSYLNRPLVIFEGTSVKELSVEKRREPRYTFRPTYNKVLIVPSRRHSPEPFPYALLRGVRRLAGNNSLPALLVDVHVDGWPGYGISGSGST